MHINHGVSSEVKGFLLWFIHSCSHNEVDMLCNDR